MKFLTLITFSVILSLSTAYSQTNSFKATKRLAEKGDLSAQYELGVMNYTREGILKSYLAAYVWLSIATARDYKDARLLRDNVADRLTPELRARGQEQVKQCIESQYKDCDSWPPYQQETQNFFIEHRKDIEALEKAMIEDGFIEISRSIIERLISHDTKIINQPDFTRELTNKYNLLWNKSGLLYVARNHGSKEFYFIISHPYDYVYMKIAHNITNEHEANSCLKEFKKMNAVCAHGS